MSTSTAFTAERLLAMPPDGKRYELVRGELRVMSPSGNEHGAVVVRLTWRLAKHVEENRLGIVFAAETGFVISQNPDTVRAPDIAFVSQARLDVVGEVDGYWPGSPDLAVEVTSPSDSFSNVEEKALGWLAAGSKIVWVVDPKQKNVTVYRSKDDIRVLDWDSELDATELLPGWKTSVAELFLK
jgi:Uma2 family endonuclease